MRKIAFYGVGERFEKHVVNNSFICEKLRTCTIARFIDQN